MATAIPGDALPQPAIEPPAPGWPRLFDTLDFGLPAGNGHRPQKLALDSARRRLYTLNEGLSDRPAGNTVSVINLDTGQITGMLRLNNRPANQSFPPAPLALQQDPYRPRLYALFGDRYGGPADTSLAIIDTDTLTVVDTIAGVDAVTPGPDRLYLVADSRLWTIDPESLTELDSRPLEACQFNDTLLMFPAANRLYLQRGCPGTLQVFAADTLQPAGRYTSPSSGELLQITVDDSTQRLLVLESDGENVSLRAFNTNGEPLNSPAPVLFSKDLTYNSQPLVLTGDSIFVQDRDPDDYRAHPLRQFSRADFSPQPLNLSLRHQPDDLTVDPTTGHLYAAFAYPDSFLLNIDPATNQIAPLYTARTIVDALLHAEANRLYLLTNDGTLRVLNARTYAELGRADTGFNTTTRQYDYEGQLSLDSDRNRLYLSGFPVRVVNTETMQTVPYPGSRGQLTPHPTTDRLYLTPPCQCRRDQCNTWLVSADTLTGTETIFPPEEPLTAPCALNTQLDAANDLLYATIGNGVPGSNGGSYLMVFDVAAQPEKIGEGGDISYGRVVFDSAGQRAFAPRYRIHASFLGRFEQQGQAISQTLELLGGAGQLAYDSAFNRLYSVSDNELRVFDDDLALLAHMSLPGYLDVLAFDANAQRLYLADDDGQLLIIASGGGQPAPPPSQTTVEGDYLPWLRVAPNGTWFRMEGGLAARSVDNGQTWQSIGMGLPGHPITDVAFSPNFVQDQTVLLGMAHMGQGGGLYRSTDGGDTFLPATRGLTDLELDRIFFSPTFGRDQTVFVTTQYRGLFRSTDGGDTWQSLASTYAENYESWKISSLSVSPSFADDGLLLASHYNLLRSTNGGDSWQDTGLPAGLVAVSPNFTADGLILLDGHWRSTDRGQSWQPAAAGLAPARQTKDILFSPNFTADKTVYILLQQNYGQSIRLQRSVDGGQSWQSLLTGLPAGFPLVRAAMLPSGDLYLIGDDRQTLTVSPDAFTWGDPGIDPTQIDLQALAVGTDGTLFVANSAAGVFKSADGGQSWQAVNFPARANEIDPAILALTADGTLFAGVGSILERSSDGGQHWDFIEALPRGFSPVSLAVSPNFQADGVVLAGGNYADNRLFRSVDGGESWQTVFDGDTVAGAAEITALAFAPDFVENGRVFAWLEDGGLLVSVDGGKNWQLRPSPQENLAVQTLAAAPDGRLFLGALDGHVLVSADAGESWQNLSEAIPDHRMWSRTLAFVDDRTILLGTDIGIFRTVDGGQSWVESSVGLPLDGELDTIQAVRALVVGQHGRVYAALNAGGVYVSGDEGQTWQSSRVGLPPVQVKTPPPPVVTSTVEPDRTLADCTAPPQFFADLWQAQFDRLGCPTVGRRVTLAGQDFEGGQMFWRSDNVTIYVLPTGQPYAEIGDTWDGSQPPYSCPDLAPSQTPPTPQRGFGKVWCNEPGVRQQLGAALGPETPFDGVAQDFEQGTVFELAGETRYLLTGKEGQWEMLE